MSIGDPSHASSARPLAGLAIVVTRAEHQAQELAEPLRTLGAHVILLPMIGIAPPADTGPLNRAIESIAQYDWIFFTSINAAQAVVPCVGTRPAARVGVVGAATQACVEKLGWRVDLVPIDFTAEGLLAALEVSDLRGQRVLIPSGDLARDVLPATLRSRGATVDVIEAYRNQMPPDTGIRARLLFASPMPPDWLTFASPSAVDNLAAVVGPGALQLSKIASIGPVTSAAVRAHGLAVAVEPADHTIAGLVAAIVDSVVAWKGNKQLTFREHSMSGSETSDAVKFEGVTPILRVEDIARSVDYYVQKLGFEIDFQTPGFVSVRRDRCCLFLCEGDQGNPGSWVWVGVEDVDALFEQYRQAGVHVRNPPTNYAWAREMQVEDPDGNVLRLGSESKSDQPVGEWLDMRGARWAQSQAGEWTRVSNPSPGDPKH